MDNIPSSIPYSQKNKMKYIDAIDQTKVGYWA